jgi:glutathione S-transferase
MDVLVDSIKKEYAVLELRLSVPSQRYIALSDRLSIADLAFLPFTNAHIAATAGIDFSIYPSLTKWSEQLMQLPQVVKCFGQITKFGHE